MTVFLDSSMRIVLNGWFWDRPETGSGQYLRHLVMAFGERADALDVHILLPAQITPPANLANVTFHTLPAWPTHAGKVLWEQVTVTRAARRLAADVVHIPYWAPPLISAVPVIITIHDLIPLLLPAYRGKRLARLYTRLVCATTPRATLALTDSEASRRDIVRHLHLSPACVRAIPLAAASAYCPKPSPDDATVLCDLGLTPGYVLYLGGFDARKNVQAVCAAFAYLQQALPDARLVIAGKLPSSDTDFAPDPRRLAKEAGVPNAAITFTGFIPDADAPALYRGARAFIFPSTFEGFGLPPLEALACGVPVVASDATSLPEVVGEGGILVPQDDIMGMNQALQRLLSDDVYHTAMRQRALRQAATFSWMRTAEMTLEAYQAIAGKRKEATSVRGAKV